MLKTETKNRKYPITDPERPPKRLASLIAEKRISSQSQAMAQLPDEDHKQQSNDKTWRLPFYNLNNFRKEKGFPISAHPHAKQTPISKSLLARHNREATELPVLSTPPRNDMPPNLTATPNKRTYAAPLRVYSTENLIFNGAAVDYYTRPNKEELFTAKSSGAIDLTLLTQKPDLQNLIQSKEVQGLVSLEIYEAAKHYVKQRKELHQAPRQPSQNTIYLQLSASALAQAAGFVADSENQFQHNHLHPCQFHDPDHSQFVPIGLTAKELAEIQAKVRDEGQISANTVVGTKEANLVTYALDHAFLLFLQHIEEVHPGENHVFLRHCSATSINPQLHMGDVMKIELTEENPKQNFRLTIEIDLLTRINPSLGMVEFLKDTFVSAFEKCVELRNRLDRPFKPASLKC